MIFTDTVDIIGCNGFIGKSIIKIGSNFNLKLWSHKYLHGSNYFDLLVSQTWNELLLSKPKVVILMSWPGLPNYNSNLHLNTVLPNLIEFINKLVESGVQRIVVSGTCYEYGLIEGELSENILTQPCNSYGIAKDSLCKYLLSYLSMKEVEFSWLRIFYPYGNNQIRNSLFSQILTAKRNNDNEFKISSGNQVRDFLPVNEVAKHLLILATHPNASGIYNSGSGKPISIYNFVKSQLGVSHNNIKIIRNYYSDRIDEPKCFWANISRITSLIDSYPFSNLFSFE